MNGCTTEGKALNTAENHLDHLPSPQALLDLANQNVDSFCDLATRAVSDSTQRVFKRLLEDLAFPPELRTMPSEGLKH
jgi:hypothetical protein